MRMGSLLGIVLAAWLLIIAESYVFFEYVIPLPPIHSVGALTELALLKVGLTLGLGILWFAVIVSLTRFYFRSKLKRTPTVSS